MKYSLLTFSLMWEVERGNIRFSELCDMMQRCGIDTMDVFYTAAFDRCVADRKCCCDAHGIDVYCVAAEIPMIAGSNAKVEAALENSLRFCTDVSARRLMVVPYTIEEYRCIISADFERMKERICVGFSRALALAKERKIDICFENMPVLKVPLADEKECLHLLDRVPGLQFAFDTANSITRGADGKKLYDALRSHVHYVHLKDVRLGTTGQDICTDGRYMSGCCFDEGVVSVRDWQLYLWQDGYRGHFGIEYEALKGANCTLQEAQLQRYMRYLKSVESIIGG